MNDFNFLGTSITGLESSQRQERSWEFCIQIRPIKKDVPNQECTQSCGVCQETQSYSHLQLFQELPFDTYHLPRKGHVREISQKTCSDVTATAIYKGSQKRLKISASRISPLFYRRLRRGGISYHKRSLNETCHPILDYNNQCLRRTFVV